MGVVVGAADDASVSLVESDGAATAGERTGGGALQTELVGMIFLLVCCVTDFRISGENEIVSSCESFFVRCIERCGLGCCLLCLKRGPEVLSWFKLWRNSEYNQTMGWGFIVETRSPSVLLDTQPFLGLSCSLTI